MDISPQVVVTPVKIKSRLSNQNSVGSASVNVNSNAIPSLKERSISPIEVIILDDDDDDISSVINTGNKKDIQSKKVATKKRLVNTTDVSVRKVKKAMRIKMLESKLELMEKQINRYDEIEISLKDMISEESAYMQEARLKEKFMKTWRRYCTLIGEEGDQLIETRKKIKVSSSPFPEINRSVEKYVNRNGNFPNLFEVKQICTQANDKYDLSLKQHDIHNCAIDVFTEVGRKLQKNREREFKRNSGNLLTDKVKIEDDPADVDPTLKRKLKHNRKLAKQRTDEVFQDFVRQQYEQSEVAAVASNSDDDDSDEYDAMLEKLRKKDLIKNKKVKRSLINENVIAPKKKKKRLDKTVISVTVSSSSQEHVEHRVRIDSTSPVPKAPVLKDKLKKDNLERTLGPVPNKINAVAVNTEKKEPKSCKPADGTVISNKYSSSTVTKITRTFDSIKTGTKHSIFDKEKFQMKNNSKGLRKEATVLDMHNSSKKFDSASYSSPLRMFRDKTTASETCSASEENSDSMLFSIEPDDAIVIISDEE